MTVTELMAELKTLTYEDKIKVYDFLRKELGQEESDMMSCLHLGGAEAAQILTELLEEHAKAKV
jgi:hypothetical protein